MDCASGGNRREAGALLFAHKGHWVSRRRRNEQGPRRGQHGAIAQRVGISRAETMGTSHEMATEWQPMQCLPNVAQVVIRSLVLLVGRDGIEPSTNGLKVHCSTAELTAPASFNKPSCEARLSLPSPTGRGQGVRAALPKSTTKHRPDHSPLPLAGRADALSRRLEWHRLRQRTPETGRRGPGCLASAGCASLATGTKRCLSTNASRAL